MQLRNPNTKSQYRQNCQGMIKLSACLLQQIFLDRMEQHFNNPKAIFALPMTIPNKTTKYELLHQTLCNIYDAVIMGILCKQFPNEVNKKQKILLLY